MTAVVRVAEPADLDRIPPMYEWLFAPPGSRPPDWDARRAADRLARAMSSDRSVVLVAETDGRLVGLCTAYDELESVRYGRRVWVEDLAVDPDQRSRGIGKQLLDEAKRWGRSRGASRLQLDSGVSRTDAHRFYERESPGTRSMSYGWPL
jgi:GNAT superfamily N-acetyltransferase